METTRVIFNAKLLATPAPRRRSHPFSQRIVQTLALALFCWSAGKLIDLYMMTEYGKDEIEENFRVWVKHLISPENRDPLKALSGKHRSARPRLSTQSTDVARFEREVTRMLNHIFAHTDVGPETVDAKNRIEDRTLHIDITGKLTGDLATVFER